MFFAILCKLHVLKEIKINPVNIYPDYSLVMTYRQVHCIYSLCNCISVIKSCKKCVCLELPNRPNVLYKFQNYSKTEMNAMHKYRYMWYYDIFQMNLFMYSWITNIILFSHLAIISAFSYKIRYVLLEFFQVVLGKLIHKRV